MNRYADIFESAVKKVGIQKAENIAEKYLKKNIGKVFEEMFTSEDIVELFLKEAHKLDVDISNM